MMPRHGWSTLRVLADNRRRRELCSYRPRLGKQMCAALAPAHARPYVVCPDSGQLCSVHASTLRSRVLYFWRAKIMPWCFRYAYRPSPLHISPAVPLNWYRSINQYDKPPKVHPLTVHSALGPKVFKLLRSSEIRVISAISSDPRGESIVDQAWETCQDSRWNYRKIPT